MFRNDDSYEFDEICANCGVLIPASPPPPLASGLGDLYDQWECLHLIVE
jgi:hypothetical protein